MRRNIVGCTLIVATALLVFDMPATATPTGFYSEFADCPLGVPGLNGCFTARIESGGITIGGQTVPIVSEQTLRGGFFSEKEPEEEFVGAADGNTLTKTPQRVPGGLSGLLGCSGAVGGIQRSLCAQSFDSGAMSVTATTELAVPATAIGLDEDKLIEEAGTGISLGVRIKLENPFLGGACYIGSGSHPITFNLTTGVTSPRLPNRPIRGRFEKFTFREEGNIVVIPRNSFVDNSFAVPEATGCGGSYASMIDPVIDAKLGLPSPAGRNAAILNGTVEQTGAARVIEHSK